MSPQVLHVIARVLTVLVITMEPFDSQVVSLNVSMEMAILVKHFWAVLACPLCVIPFDMFGHPGFGLGLEVTAVTFDGAAPVSLVGLKCLFIRGLELTAITFEHI